MLNIIDEFTHESLAIRINRKLKAIDVIDALSDLFILRGVPGHIRSDNGPASTVSLVMTEAEYLKRAEQCIELARTAKPSDRKLLFAIAKAWLMLAEDRLAEDEENDMLLAAIKER